MPPSLINQMVVKLIVDPKGTAHHHPMVTIVNTAQRHPMVTIKGHVSGSTQIVVKIPPVAQMLRMASRAMVILITHLPPIQKTGEEGINGRNKSKISSTTNLHVQVPYPQDISCKVRKATARQFTTICPPPEDTDGQVKTSTNEVGQQ